MSETDDTVMMTDDLKDQIDLDSDPEVTVKGFLWVRLARDGKRSKPLRLKSYASHDSPDNSRAVQQLELSLTDTELSAVAKSLPMGFSVYLDDEMLFEYLGEKEPFFKLANPSSGAFLVTLTF